MHDEEKMDPTVENSFLDFVWLFHCRVAAAVVAVVAVVAEVAGVQLVTMTEQFDERG